MQWELGPVEVDVARAWSRTARRVVLELRTADDATGAPFAPDVLAAWSDIIDLIASDAERADARTFRSSMAIDDEQAEFLLHGLELCAQSPRVHACLSEEDIATHRSFTTHLVDSMIEGLQLEGRGCDHFRDEVVDLGVGA